MRPDGCAARYHRADALTLVSDGNRQVGLGTYGSSGKTPMGQARADSEAQEGKNRAEEKREVSHVTVSWKSLGKNLKE
jgi:hypothetical protein